MNNSTITEQIIQTKQVYKQLSIEHWLKYEVFTWQWWIGIACVVIPLFVWWKLVDKQKILEISVFGLLINVSASFLDVLGSESLLWSYTIRILPQTPLLFPVDYILLPILYMLIYQRYQAWKQFLVASTIVALALAFVVEPLAVYIEQYQLISWQFIYSFPIYILISILSKFITNKMLSRQKGTL